MTTPHPARVFENSIHNFVLNEQVTFYGLHPKFFE